MVSLDKHSILLLGGKSTNGLVLDADSYEIKRRFDTGRHILGSMTHQYCLSGHGSILTLVDHGEHGSIQNLIEISRDTL